MADEQQQQPAAAGEARVVLDADGNVVEEGDPQSARILTGPEAEQYLREHPQPARRQETAAAESKARKAPPEDKGSPPDASGGVRDK